MQLIPIYRILFKDEIEINIQAFAETIQKGLKVYLSSVKSLFLWKNVLILLK